MIQVDAFTDHPFGGNPAAVCLPGTARRDDAWHQAVAGEMNLSETAFVRSRADGGYDLRWFTPTNEVDLCGHATLAAAHALWEQTTGPGVHDAASPIVFHTRSGILTCTRAAGGLISLDFPADEPAVSDPPVDLIEALEVEPIQILRGREDWVVIVASEQAVRDLSPDFARLAQIQARGVLVSARAEDEGYDIVSRCFFPRYGINEDPVTGSAHCTLGPYWAAKLGKQELRCYQASARGGAMHVTIKGPRVELAGHAVTVLRGELVL